MTSRTITRAVALVLLTLLGGWPALAAAQTIKVGAVVPLTGRPRSRCHSSP